MAVKVLRSPKAAAAIRALPNPAIGKSVRQWVQRISDDPESAMDGVSQGHRISDGMVVGGGSAYYVQIIYTFVVGSDHLTLVNVTCREASGPH